MMWPLPRINDNHIHVILNQTTLSCAWIKPHKPRPIVAAFNSYALSPNSPEILHNPTNIRSIINSFITLHHLKNTYIHFCLGNDLLNQQILYHRSGSAKKEDFIKHPAQDWRYEIIYLANRNDMFLFYICGISQQLILQLHLIALQLPIHTLCLTSEFSLHLTLYKAIHGSSFNQHQLAQAINLEKIEIPSLFSTDLLRRCLDIQDIKPQKDLFLAFGSFLGINK